MNSPTSRANRNISRLMRIFIFGSKLSGHASRNSLNSLVWRSRLSDSVDGSDSVLSWSAWRSPLETRVTSPEMTSYPHPTSAHQPGHRVFQILTG